MGKSNLDNILMLLKKEGELDASFLASELAISKEGVRQHLVKLLEEGLVEKACKSAGVGRPCTHYSLTEHGLAQFPDTHAELTIQLIHSIKNILGENALDLLITNREHQTFDRYEKEMADSIDIESKLEKLAQIRSSEGYLAEWRKENDCYLFIENHCPIRKAATACQQLCQAEIKNFRNLLGIHYQIDRLDHIVAQDNRCVYLIQHKEVQA